MVAPGERVPIHRDERNPGIRYPLIPARALAREDKRCVVSARLRSEPVASAPDTDKARNQLCIMPNAWA
jgi:hypothetical protein